jgi:hypothetical protein
MGSALTIAAVLAGSDAYAQRLMLGGSLGGASGVEGADVGAGTQFRRARSRLELAVDGRIDEDKKQGLELRVFAEIEPHASLGGGARYLYWLAPAVTVGAGVVFDIFPHSLLGVDAAVRLVLPFPSKKFGLFLEPSFAVVPLGTDLPGDEVLLWGLVKVGFHADL